MDSQVVMWGPIGVCLVSLEALHTLSCPIAASLLDQRVLGPHPERPLRTHHTLILNQIDSSATMTGSKRRLSSNRGLGGVLREQRARLYIIRRCVVMLLCWHD
ncbi:hypothetical protein VNO77_39616 [Canavalia gladiata]|uniref:Uncharacterized protein n=1 Tax=Canavalia gladiata TaxID=3824 RepID=A0AAN9PR55_CANGL